MVGHQELPDRDGNQENHEIDDRANRDCHHKRCGNQPGTRCLQDKRIERTPGGADERARQGATDQAAQSGGNGN